MMTTMMSALKVQKKSNRLSLIYFEYSWRNRKLAVMVYFLHIPLLPGYEHALSSSSSVS